MIERTPDRGVRTPHILVLLAVCVCGIAGCGRPPGASIDGIVLRLEPDLSYGSTDDVASMLSHIRSVAVSNDGYVVVADRARRGGPLKVFGPDGRFVRDVGSPGQGPGEFEFIRSVNVVDDRIVAVDDRAFEFFSY